MTTPPSYQSGQPGQPYEPAAYQQPPMQQPQWQDQPYQQPAYPQQAQAQPQPQWQDQPYQQTGYPQQAQAQPQPQWQEQAYQQAAYAPPQPQQQQWQHPQQVQPQLGMGMPGPNALQCRFCGCVPAVNTKFRGHRGMIVLMTFLSLEGPFCRDCGLSTFRRMTASTLITGWWGVASVFITPATVLLNLARRGKVANLPPPSPPPSGRYEQPMDPGKPVLARPGGVIGLIIAIAVVSLFVIGAFQ